MNKWTSNRRIIKTFDDGTSLFFGRGSFDDWCVFYLENGKASPPKDFEYFNTLQDLSDRHGTILVWRAFMTLYNHTKKDFSPILCNQITKLTQIFNEDALLADKIFTILYVAMIAEENKEGTILGKMIKALGVHQSVIERMDTMKAANFSKGMKAKEIRRECSKRNITRKKIAKVNKSLQFGRMTRYKNKLAA